MEVVIYQRTHGRFTSMSLPSTSLQDEAARSDNTTTAFRSFPNLNNPQMEILMDESVRSLIRWMCVQDDPKQPRLFVILSNQVLCMVSDGVCSSSFSATVHLCNKPYRSATRDESVGRANRPLLVLHCRVWLVLLSWCLGLDVDI